MSEQKHENLINTQNYITQRDELAEQLEAACFVANTYEQKYKSIVSERDELSSRCEMLEEQYNDVYKYKKIARNQKKELDQYRDKIVKLERDMILKDGKIQQLEESRRDVKERYTELKADYRDQMKWNLSNRNSN